MAETPSFQVVQLTPPGRGAVATILVEGPGAVDAVGRQFRSKSGRPLESFDCDRLVFGRFGPRPGEEVVTRRCRTGSVELHCHGGSAAAAMIERTMAAAGGRAVEWQDWVADRYQDPIAAAAYLALAEAPTERTAAILLDQYHGALQRGLDEIGRALGNNDAAAARKLADVLLARYAIGRHLVRPWRVVLAGRPNVGKSSLINALVGYPRVIVHHAAGTTRDVVTVQTALDGWPIELCDTAGLHQRGNAEEQAGVKLARQKLAAAELVILVFDAGQQWSAADRALVRSWPQALVVHNKSDLPSGGGSRAAGLATSALRGEGIEALQRAVVDRLVPQPPPPGAAVPFTAEQVEQIARRAGVVPKREP